jgi:hypothetical protein
MTAARGDARSSRYGDRDTAVPLRLDGWLPVRCNSNPLSTGAVDMRLLQQEQRQETKTKLALWPNTTRYRQRADRTLNDPERMIPLFNLTTKTYSMTCVISCFGQVRRSNLSGAVWYEITGNGLISKLTGMVNLARQIGVRSAEDTWPDWRTVEPVIRTLNTS